MVTSQMRVGHFAVSTQLGGPRACALIGALALCLLAAPSPASQLFILPPSPTRNGTGVYDISGDGTTVIGVDGGLKAASWNLVTGVETYLPDRFGGWGRVEAFGVSEDGRVIVGDASELGASWVDGAITVLPAAYGHASNVSRDGRVIVGGDYTTAGGLEVVRWVDGVEEKLPSSLVGGYANAVSGDGSVIGGSLPRGGGYRWQNGVVTPLPGLGGTYGGVDDMTPDGSILVGNAALPGTSIGPAVRWVNGAIESLGDLPGGPLSAWANTTSADGTLIGGQSWNTTSLIAFLWDPVHGMRDAKTALKDDYGIDTTGWVLTSVNGISDDGRVVVGNGYTGSDTNSVYRGWVAFIPEPAPALLLALGLGGIALRPRKAAAAI